MRALRPLGSWAAVRFGVHGWVMAGSESRRSARDGRGPGAFATAPRLANARASSECGGPPPLWNTSSFPTQATMVRSLGRWLCASRETFANSCAGGKFIHPLLGRICVGPQRRRAGRTPRRWRASRPLLWMHRAETCGRCGRWIIERGTAKRPFVSRRSGGRRLVRNRVAAPETGADRSAWDWLRRLAFSFSLFLGALILCGWN